MTGIRDIFLCWGQVCCYYGVTLLIALYHALCWFVLQFISMYAFGKLAQHYQLYQVEIHWKERTILARLNPILWISGYHNIKVSSLSSMLLGTNVLFKLGGRVMTFRACKFVYIYLSIVICEYCIPKYFIINVFRAR